MDRYAYDESGRRRWVLVAGAVLAIAALLAVAFLVGRSTAPSGGGRAQVVNVQSGPGPTRVVNGVPVGYAHTQAGAVAAATNFLMVVDGPLVTQPDKYRVAIDTLSAPAARDKQRSDAEKMMNSLQSADNLLAYVQQGRTVIFRLSPLAYRVDRYEDQAAQTSIWAEGFIAVDGVLSMRETWSTSTVSVQWTGGDWRLIGIGAPTAESFGPVPTAVQQPLQSSSLPSQLVTYRSYQVDVGS